MLAAVIRPSRLLLVLLAVLFARDLTAITWVVPADRFEIDPIRTLCFKSDHVCINLSQQLECGLI